MKVNMPIGIDNFKKAKEEYYLVDKTRFICQLIDKHAAVTLFTRPRRFGKTLNMSMVEYFFSIDKKDESKTLFQDMDVAKAGTSYMEQRGKYPVVFMTLKDCAELTWEDTYEQFKLFIRKEYKKHPYLLTSNLFSEDEIAAMKRIIMGTASDAEYKCSLGDLSAYLYRYFGTKAIILIDEYDAPIQSAYAHGFYDEAISFFRRWLSIALKGNDSLHFAILTGVLRIAKESVFSGLNNLEVFSVLSTGYGDTFGFTAEEIKHMAQTLGYADKIDEIRYWYDGYRFGNVEIYNPWSVIMYFSKGCVPAPYWMRTSDNGILRQLLYQATSLQIEALQELLEGKAIPASINENIVYRVLSIEKKALYTVLLTTGYLTVESVVEHADSRYLLRIPNEEIKRVYRLEILDTLTTETDSDTFENLFDSLLAGRAATFEALLQELLVYFVSTYDTAKQESFYHGFMLGITALFLNKNYVVESNRESGYGRFDLAIFPKDTTKAGVIMEFKVAPSEAALEEKAKEGVQQIENKEYIAEFHKRGIQNVWKYGIAFHGKNVMIRKEK